MKVIDITGHRFGSLIVTRRSTIKNHGEIVWECLCDCKKVILVPGSRLRQGHTKSCGCYKRSRIGDITRKHGKSKTPEYIMFYDAVKRAKKRKVSINITPDDIIIPTICPVLRIPLIPGLGLKSPNTPTLDCIDPSKGYIKGNIQVVSWRYNKFKSDLTPSELIRIAEWVLR